MTSYQITQYRKPFNVISEKIYNYIAREQLKDFHGDDSESLAARLIRLAEKVKKNNPRATGKVNIEHGWNASEQGVVRVSNGEGITCLLIRVVTTPNKPKKVFRMSERPVISDGELPF